jgi:hypothetical protein
VQSLHTGFMAILTHPTWSKVVAGLLLAALTATAGVALDTRDAVKDHERRIQNVEKAIEVIPDMAKDIAVLRDRSDREHGVK